MNADEAVNALIAGDGTAEDVIAALLPLLHAERGPRTPIGLDVEIDPESPAFRLYSGYINGRVSREDYATVLDALRGADMDEAERPNQLGPFLPQDSASIVEQQGRTGKQVDVHEPRWRELKTRTELAALDLLEHVVGTYEDLRVRQRDQVKAELIGLVEQLHQASAWADEFAGLLSGCAPTLDDLSPTALRIALLRDDLEGDWLTSIIGLVRAIVVEGEACSDLLWRAAACPSLTADDARLLVGHLLEHRVGDIRAAGLTYLSANPATPGDVLARLSAPEDLPVPPRYLPASSSWEQRVRDNSALHPNSNAGTQRTASDGSVDPR